ncbi:hypothetical protein ABZ815_20470 [Nonomuraea sp. NPDC047529]
MRGIASLLAVMAWVYESLGTLMTIAFGWAVLWAVTQGLVALVWAL